MSAQLPRDVESAYTVDNLVGLVEANEYGPKMTTEMAERIIDLAARRTQTRGESTVDRGRKDFLVMTTWDNFCRDTFGSDEVNDNNVPNRYALVVPHWKASSGRNAWLCKEAVAVQQGWLESGDGRRSQLEQIDQTHTSYHDERGEFWAPKEHTAVLGFGDELVYEDPKLADAM